VTAGSLRFEDFKEHNVKKIACSAIVLFAVLMVSGCNNCERDCCDDSAGAQKSQSISGEREPEKPAQKSSKKTASADEVPEAVKKAFQVKFPSVKIAEWKIKSDKTYEAEFTVNGTEITVIFESSGKWLETESAIDPAEVPKAVNIAAAEHFKGYKVIETQSVERWNERHLIYELHFENAKDLAKAQFSSDGAILRQSSKVKP